MKNIIYCLFLSFTIVSCGQTDKKNKTTNQDNYKKYPFKSAIITYAVSGNTKGQKQLYIDDYGYREAAYSQTKMKFMGVEETENKVSILIGSDIVEVDIENNTATKTSNPFAAAYAKEIGKDYIELGENALTTMGFKKTGMESILGKNCTIWEGMSKLWVWKGLTLKSETKMMGMTIKEIATNIEIDAKVSQNKFELPVGVEIQELDNPIEELGGFQDALNEEITDEDREAMAKMKKMSFAEWKKQVQKNDAEMAKMSDKELRPIYDMMLKFGN